MRYLTLHKGSMLNTRPDLFAKFVWRGGEARVTVLEMKDDSYIVSGEGSGIVSIPKSILKPRPRQ